MTESSIPAISSGAIEDGLARFTPLILKDGEAFQFRPVHPRNTAFTWEPDIVGEAIPFKVRREATTRHSCGYHGFFKPSVAEVLAQLPDDLPADCNAFYIDTNQPIGIGPGGAEHLVTTTFGVIDKAALPAIPPKPEPEPVIREVDSDPDLKAFLDGVVGVVEDSSSFVGFSLWLQNKESKSPRTWESPNTGSFRQIGEIGGFPVCIRLSTPVVDGFKLLFVDPTSRVVDHEMIREWLKRNLPHSAYKDEERLNITDANNFHTILHHLEWNRDGR